MPETPVEIIDYFLGRWSQRELVSVSEVSDLLLDLRKLVALPLEVPQGRSSVDIVS